MSGLTIALGILGGAGLSAGGSALSAGQAGSADDTARRRARSSGGTVTSEVNPLSNPLIAMIVSQSLARFGVVEPSILQGIGPLGRTIEAIRSSGLTGQEQFGAIALLRDLQTDMAGQGVDIFGRPKPAISLEEAEMKFRQSFSHQFIRQFGGFETFGELLAAEQQYQQTVGPQVERLNQIAQLSGGRQLAVETALSQITGNAAQLADFDSLLQGERTRLLRDFDTERTRALSSANFGGFNPAGTLERLEDSRQDIDLLALERAAGLSNARTGSLANAAALLGSLDPTANAGQLNIPLLSQTGGTAQLQQQAGSGASALGTGLQGIGSGITSAALLAALTGDGSTTGATAPASGAVSGSGGMGLLNPAWFGIG